MTPTQHLIATQAQRLIPEISNLYDRALKLERDHSAELEQIDLAYRDSGRNLLHYLAIRQLDIRRLQIEQAALGLSSLGR
jgi:pyruvate kinase